MKLQVYPQMVENQINWLSKFVNMAHKRESEVFLSATKGQGIFPKLLDIKYW